MSCSWILCLELCQYSCINEILAVSSLSLVLVLSWIAVPLAIMMIVHKCASLFPKHLETKAACIIQ